MVLILATNRIFHRLGSFRRLASSAKITSTTVSLIRIRLCLLCEQCGNRKVLRWEKNKGWLWPHPQRCTYSRGPFVHMCTHTSVNSKRELGGSTAFMSCPCPCVLPSVSLCPDKLVNKQQSSLEALGQASISCPPNHSTLAACFLKPQPLIAYKFFVLFALLC